MAVNILICMGVDILTHNPPLPLRLKAPQDPLEMQVGRNWGCTAPAYWVVGLTVDLVTRPRVVQVDTQTYVI